MWKQIPFDLLAKAFSFLPPDFARAGASCRHWRACTMTYISNTLLTGRNKCMPPWFIAIYMRNRGLQFYAYDLITNRWHVIPLRSFLSEPIVSIGSFILCKVVASSPVQLTLCNPFTNEFQHLPQLLISRTNIAVGVITDGDGTFKIYVAGGMSQAEKSSNASYEQTMEMYESRVNKWKLVGRIPIELSARLTVWTQNASVYLMGVLYWITSARAYTVMGFEVESGAWKELKVPMADRLEFAALIQRKGRLTLVGGGTCIGKEACIWELGVGDVWLLVQSVPNELGKKFMGPKGSWCNTKCVGSNEGNILYLYRDLESNMLVWKEESENGKWEWLLIEGCCSKFRGRDVSNYPIKGLVFHPSLSASCNFSRNLESWE